MKRLLGLATVLVLATGTGARAECYPPNPSHGAGSVDRTRVAPGDCVTFSGTGFRPRATVAIADNGESRGTARANQSGAFSTQVCFASDVPPGQHTLTGTGPSHGPNECEPGQPGERTVAATVYVLGVSVVAPPGEVDEGRGDGGGGGGGGVDVGGVGGDRGGDGGGLPRTGDITMLETLAGLALVLFGGAVLIAARPRRRSASAA